MTQFTLNLEQVWYCFLLFPGSTWKCYLWRLRLLLFEAEPQVFIPMQSMGTRKNEKKDNILLLPILILGLILI